MQLSRDIETVNETDYNNVAISYIIVRPKFDDVLDWFNCSYPIWQDISVAKTEIKSLMTDKWLVWDTEV